MQMTALFAAPGRHRRWLSVSGPLLLVLLTVCGATPALAADQLDLRVRLSLDRAQGKLDDLSSVLAEARVATQDLRLDLEALGASVRPALGAEHGRALSKVATGAEEQLEEVARWVRVQAPIGAADAVRELLGSSPVVDLMEPALAAEIALVPDDEFVANQALLLGQIGAFEGWSLVRGSDGDAVIAIVDGGTDWTHQDLAANIWENPGEIAGNGVDDDGNGFVDDVRGWNFATDGPDPRGLPEQTFNRDHGTHVAGIAGAVTDNGQGVTGVSWNARILPINAAHPEIDRVILYGYEGILYAALMGADVINCSWRRAQRLPAGFGGARILKFEQAVVEAASALGAVVVGAAGNDQLVDEAIYPAAYPTVLSVGATDENGRRWVFSNVGGWIDVMAPGTLIYSTVADGGYRLMSGTSMAAPVVAGLAALLRTQQPQWTPEQVRQQLRWSSKDLDPLHPGLEGRLGGGLVQMPSALGQSPIGVFARAVALEDEDGDQLPEGGEVLSFQVELANVLASAEGLLVDVETDDPHLILLERNVRVPRLGTGQSLVIQRGLTAWLDYSAPIGHVARVRVVVRHETRAQCFEFPLTVRPLHATLATEGLELSLTSVGKIGFADLAGTWSLGGVGLRRPGRESVLFGGGLLVGVGPDQVADAVAAWAPDDPFEDFRPIQGEGLVRESPGSGLQILLSRFSDRATARRLGVGVEQKGIAFEDPVFSDLVLVRYEFTAQLGPLQGVRAGLLLDWDLGSRLGSADRLLVDENRRLLWVEADEPPRPPFGTESGVAGVAVLAGPGGFASSWLYDFGRSEDEDRTYLYDLGDTSFELGDSTLWDLLSGVPDLDSAPAGELAATVSMGPFDLQAGGRAEMVVAFLLADDRDGLFIAHERARAAWRLVAGDGDSPLPARDTLLANVPNPFNPRTSIRFALVRSQRVRLDVYDTRGRHVISILDEVRPAGFHQSSWDGRDATGHSVSSGVYRLLLRTEDRTSARAVTLLR